MCIRDRLGTLPLDESEDDGEQGKGRKHGRGSHRKKRKKYILWAADKYDLSVDFDYHDWSGNEAIFDHFI